MDNYLDAFQKSCYKVQTGAILVLPAISPLFFGRCKWHKQKSQGKDDIKQEGQAKKKKKPWKEFSKISVLGDLKKICLHVFQRPNCIEKAAFVTKGIKNTSIHVFFDNRAFADFVQAKSDTSSYSV